MTMPTLHPPTSKTDLVQDTYSNMAASEKFIRDGSISVGFMGDAREVT